MECVKILGQIRCPQHQTANAFMGKCDILGVQHAKRRFHHAPKRQVGGPAGVIQDGNGVFDHLPGFDFWQQNGVRTDVCHGPQIIFAPRRIQAVDPNHQFAMTVSAFRQRACNLFAPHGLRIGCDGVLQIKDQGIGSQAATFFQGPGIGAGHIKNRPARSCGLEF